MNRSIFKVAIASASLFIFGLAHADDAKLAPIIDMSTPHSAAQTLLGLDPSKVDSTTKLTTLAVNYLRSGGSDKVGDGFSLSMALMQLRQDKTVGARDWERNAMGFRLANFTQLSAALVAGSGTTSPAKAAWGITFPLLDKTDWRTNTEVTDQYIDLYKKNLRKFDNGVPQSFNWRHDVLVRIYDRNLAHFRDGLDGLLNNLTLNPKGTQAEEEAFATLKKNYRDAARDYADAIHTVAGKVRSDTKMPVIDDVHPDGRWQDFWKAKQLSITLGGAREALNNTVNAKTFDQDVPQMKKLSDQFEKQASSYFWNREKLDLAAGQSWASVDNTYKNLTPSGFHVWGTYTLPLEKSDFVFEQNADDFVFPTQSSLTLYASWLKNNRTFKSGTLQAGEDGYEVGARIKRGTLKSSMFVEGLYKSTKLAGVTTSKTTWDLGLEYQLQKSQWLQFSIGNDLNSPQGVLFKLGYNFNLSSAQTYDVTKS